MHDADERPGGHRLGDPAPLYRSSQVLPWAEADALGIEHPQDRLADGVSYADLVEHDGRRAPVDDDHFEFVSLDRRHALQRLARVVIDSRVGRVRLTEIDV